MRDGLRRTLAAWREAGRKAGFALLLAGGSAALGFLIAAPLWLFATSARQAYSITVLALAAAGIVFLVARGIVRRSASPRDPLRPGRSALGGLVTAVMVIVGFGGLYLAAALLVRGIWVLGAISIAIWAALLWALGRARAAIRLRFDGRKPRAFPAENRRE